MSAFEDEVHELRCQHELARQLLPLGSAREVARDGLLCMAGITGIGAGAVLWDDGGTLQLLSHFGLHGVKLEETYALSLEARAFLVTHGVVSCAEIRRRSGGRAVADALQPLFGVIGDAWCVPLLSERQLRGVLLVGPSLVTQSLLPDPGRLADLAETLRLALVGRSGQAQAVVSPASGPSAPRRDAASSLAERLRALRSTYPATRAVVGESAAIAAFLEELVSLARTDYTVMIHGGTGTGKELAASLLHGLSKRAAGPFEAVDCSSIPRELIESELFGHVRGAFTGATRDFRGAFERADGGTLILDEIGDMDLSSQTRLLRVLQEGKVRQLGGDRSVGVDVRVVAATNRDLATMVQAGTFREDLYYRVHVCLLSLPGLRQRGEDCLLLFDHFMRHYAETLGRAPRSLTSAGRERLLRADFPGNVRQLQNLVRQLLVQGRTTGDVDRDELEQLLARSVVLPARRDAVAVDAAVLAPPTREAEVHSAAQGGEPDAAVGAQTEAVIDIGAWVLVQLRKHRFNMTATAKDLEAARRAGTSRRRVPICDRGALDYYLCGEFLERLLQHRFDLAAAVRDLAAQSTLEARVGRKVTAYVRVFESFVGKARADVDLLASPYFGRLPERYHAALQKVTDAVLTGAWKPLRAEERRTAR